MAGSKKVHHFFIFHSFILWREEAKDKKRATCKDYHYCKSNYALLTTIIENLLGLVHIIWWSPTSPHCPREPLVLCVVCLNERLSLPPINPVMNLVVLQNFGEFGWWTLYPMYTIFLFRQKKWPQMGYYLLHSKKAHEKIIFKKKSFPYIIIFLLFIFFKWTETTQLFQTHTQHLKYFLLAQRQIGQVFFYRKN